MIRAIALACCLTACASASGVVPLGGEAFTVSRQAATGFSGMGNLRAEALQEAGQHCAAQGRTLHVTNERESQPPYLLGNYPRIDVDFTCAP